MDAIDSAIDPLRDFAKSSIRLVQRCHKPDRKGTSAIFNFFFFNLSEIRGICYGSLDPFSICNFDFGILFITRIHEGGCAYGDRICGDGIRRVLREARFHPNQQHHRWIFLA